MPSLFIRKPTNSSLFNAAVAATIALNLSTPSAAQDNSSTANEVLPSLQAAADLELPDGRNITIHREAGVGQQRATAIYFHRPLFAFVENSNKSDHPVIWDKAEEDDDVYIRLRLTLSTPRFRELARNAVIDEDPSIHAEKPEIEGRNIDVRSWPLKLLRLEAENSLTGRKYGEIKNPESLRTSGDTIDVSMQVPSKDYPDFLQALKAGRLKFSPSYTFKNAVVAFGQSTSRVSGEVSVAISEALRSAQLEEGAPIFQEDLQRLQNTLTQAVTTKIRATDSSVLAHITPQDISGQILKPQQITFADLSSDNPLLAKVETYLVPIIRKMASEEGVDDEENETETTTNKQKIKLGVGTKTGGSADIELEREKKLELEKKHKVTFRDTEEKDVIEPHSIEVHYVREGWQENLLEIFQTVYLAVGIDSSFQTDSSVRADFTTDVLDQAMGANDIVVARYSGVPKGVPMFSLRADIPKGWVALDGLTNWPNENWVPSHLRGKPVPDMRGAFARGAVGEEKVGVENRGQALTIPGISISGSDFVMTEDGRGGVLNGAGKVHAWVSNGKQGQGRQVGSYPVTTTTLRKSGPNGTSPFRDDSEVVQLTSRIVPMFTGALTGGKMVAGQTLSMDQQQNQPPHVAGQWIMRME